MDQDLLCKINHILNLIFFLLTVWEDSCSYTELPFVTVFFKRFLCSLYKLFWSFYLLVRNKHSFAEICR